MYATEFSGEPVVVRHKFKVGDTIVGLYDHQDQYSSKHRYTIQAVEHGVHYRPNYTFSVSTGGGNGWDFIETFDDGNWTLVPPEEEQTVITVLRDAYNRLYNLNPSQVLTVLGLDPSMKLGELKERLK